MHIVSLLQLVHCFHVHVPLYPFSPSICCPWFSFGSLHTDFPLTHGACCLWTLGLSVMRTVDLDLSFITITLSMLDASLHPCSPVTIVTSPIAIIIATYHSYSSLSPASFTWPHLLPYPPPPSFFIPTLSGLCNRVITAVRWADGQSEWTGNYEWISSHS